MIDKLTASGEFVFIIKDELPTTFGGLQIPETAQRKPNTGKIISVGKLVKDLSVKKGRTAIFNKQVGTEIEIFDTSVTVLNGNSQVLGTY